MRHFTLVVFCILIVLLPCVFGAQSTPIRSHYKSFVKPKQNVIKARTNQRTQLNLGDHAGPFYNHCMDIFKEENLVSQVIRGMISGILDKLHELCLDKPVHPLIHKVFTETLLCGGSMSEAIDSIIDILFGKFERNCRERPGFQSYYILTSAQNEIVESKG
ncbi:uncharacterized protein LOC26526890 [Drosophila erecta]|uniref:uncharacterized protein LOC26526890 n=1 Tax=Drosophila erecta TaxID=7220 RepID=UPI0007329DC8|nr:uncharacterized protein LOC26526890 [Drosophila erecta]KQS38579.1 uncharacterized protein Dere_GG27066 [Drosophila erecta]